VVGTSSKSTTIFFTQDSFTLKCFSPDVSQTKEKESDTHPFTKLNYVCENGAKPLAEQYEQYCECGCKDATEKKNEAYRKMTQRCRTCAMVEEYRQLRRQEKGINRYHKRQYKNNLLEEIEHSRLKK
jgi:hypothetical protein